MSRDKVHYEVIAEVPTHFGFDGENFGNSVEDGGQAMILTPEYISQSGGDGHIFLGVQSWHDGAETNDPNSHPLFRKLLGRKIKITLETIDED